MELVFDQAMDDTIVEGPGVTGVLCTDQQGLCLGVRGKACTSSSGVIANIASKASQIEPSNTEEPVIFLDSNNLQCIIQKQGNITLAIFKSPQPSSTG